MHIDISAGSCINYPAHRNKIQASQDIMWSSKRPMHERISYILDWYIDYHMQIFNQTPGNIVTYRASAFVISASIPPRIASNLDSHTSAATCCLEAVRLILVGIASVDSWCLLLLDGDDTSTSCMTNSEYLFETKQTAFGYYDPKDILCVPSKYL